MHHHVCMYVRTLAVHFDAAKRHTSSTEDLWNAKSRRNTSRPAEGEGIETET